MSPERTILVVEDDALLREQVVIGLRADFRVLEAGTQQEALGLLSSHPPDVVLLDLQLQPQGNVDQGFAVLQQLRQNSSDAVVIVMTGDPQRGTRLRAIEEGAYDCFCKPFDLRELKLVISRSLERLDLERENRRLKAEVVRQSTFQELIGCSPAMARVFDTIRRVADSSGTVLLIGESGTGKELAARAIHLESSRRSAPFVPVHCSALPETLIESELFGHEKGAFTGATSARAGRFEMAHGGTLFLDEVGTLNLNLQTKLLRVLEEKEFERIGGQKTIQVDIRLVAATNVDLEKLVAKESFREDLYFRLNVLPVRLPPLRERTEDIPVLANHFARIYSQQCKVPPKKLAPETVQRLVAYSWKGNVRELENAIQRAVLLSDGEMLLPEHLPAHIGGSISSNPAGNGSFPNEGLDMAAAVAQFERNLLEAALGRTSGVKSQAANLLGLTKEQMKYLCRKHGL
jgi:two-component system response regulator PilR (NtrC family)